MYGKLNTPAFRLRDAMLQRWSREGNASHAAITRSGRLTVQCSKTSAASRSHYPHRAIRIGASCQPAIMGFTNGCLGCGGWLIQVALSLACTSLCPACGMRLHQKALTCAKLDNNPSLGIRMLLQPHPSCPVPDYCGCSYSLTHGVQSFPNGVAVCRCAEWIWRWCAARQISSCSSSSSILIVSDAP